MPRADDVQHMFDRIAGRYDLLNRIMTGGVDRRWRRAAVRTVGAAPGVRALDVCCGTGDLAFLLADAGAGVIGLDFSANMLEVARRRAGERGDRGGSVEFVQGDALALPFEDDSFDALTVAFGVRNVERLGGAFEEFARVLRPGGTVACLEITRPANRIAGGFYRVWFDRVVPVVGGLISGDREAYSYLPQSTLDFPRPRELAELMRESGFADVDWRTFAGGIVALHRGTAMSTTASTPDDVSAAARTPGPSAAAT